MFEEYCKKRRRGKIRRRAKEEVKIAIENRSESFSEEEIENSLKELNQTYTRMKKPKQDTKRRSLIMKNNKKIFSSTKTNKNHYLLGSWILLSGIVLLSSALSFSVALAPGEASAPSPTAKLATSSLPDLVSGTNDEPIVAVVGQDAYISCVANNLKNYTIIWRFSNDAHAPGLAATGSSSNLEPADSTNSKSDSSNSKLEDADASATILTAGRQRVTSDERFSVIRSHNTWLLKISGVRLTDTGTYICQTNSEPRVRALRILSVLKSTKSNNNTTSNSNSNYNPLIDSAIETIDPSLRGQHLAELDFNFTDCCRQEYVFPRCQKLCSIQQLASTYHTINIVHECYSALPSITRCMVAGRNVADCCEKRHVPQRCHSMCGESADSTMSMSIQDQSYCADYSASIMSCVTEGINTLPGQPELVIVEAVSSSSLKVSWQRVTDESELKKIDGWIIKLTKLSSFEDTISSPSSSSSRQQLINSTNTTTNSNGVNKREPSAQSMATNNNNNSTGILSNLSILDVREASSLAAMTRLLAASNATINLKLDKQVNEFSIDNLKPYTVYQIQMFAFNSQGRSQVSDPIRALTLAPENDDSTTNNTNANGDKNLNTNTPPDSDEFVEPNLPDTRKCCESRGVTLRKCVDTLCDPIEADRAKIEDLMVCAPWSNVTFSCLSSGVDHSDCCRSRGVTPFCLGMCSGEVKRLDFRHFRCLTHMSTYTNCILESHDVLPSAPQNFTVGPITASWAVLNWRPPRRRAKSLQGYRIFWRRFDPSPGSQNGADIGGGNILQQQQQPITNSSLKATSSAASASLATSGSAPVNDDVFFSNAEAATNPYLLDSLAPDTVYETFVVAVNKYGQSKPSTRFLFQTLADLPSSGSSKAPSSQGDLESRLPLSHGGNDQQSSYYNETNCCLNSGVPASCRQLCDYNLKVSDAYDLITSCSGQMPAIMRCLAGQRNSVPCCRTRGVSDQCLNVCAGLTEHSPLMVATQCGSDFGKIIRCLDEGSKQIPSAPLDLHATEVRSDAITVAWKPSAEDTFRTDVEYHVRYQQLQSSGSSDESSSSESGATTRDLSALIAVVPLHPLEHNHILTTNKTQATIDKLRPGQRYSLYLTAENPYGISLPSLVLVLETPLVDSDATEDHKRKATLGPPHSLEILRSDTESMVLRWAPPLYLDSDSQIRYRVFYKLLGSLPSGGSTLEADSSSSSEPSGAGEVQQVSSNWTALETSYTSIPLRNLAYSSQYAITVQAFTKNLRGHMSELLLAATAKPIPPSINPPFIINQPIEGNNITIMCVALGQPTPQISMFINGLLVQKRTQPYVVYHLVNLVRGQLTITCFASNGRGKDYASVQSRTEISVKFPPRAIAKVREVRSNTQSTARLSCLVSGNPQPSVVWSFVGGPAKSGSVIVPNERVTTLIVSQFDSPTTWSHTLTLRNVSKHDAGSYQCRAVNFLNESSDSLELKVNEATSTQLLPLISLNDHSSSSDLMQCCKSQNVSSNCLPVCSLDGLDIERAFKTPECQANLDKLMFCAADGSDHRSCCRQRQVPFSCLRWCSGAKLNIPAICFLSSAVDINQCFQEGRTLLPGPPRNLRAIMASDSSRLSGPMVGSTSDSTALTTTMQLPIMAESPISGPTYPSLPPSSSPGPIAGSNMLDGGSSTPTPGTASMIGRMALAFGDVMSDAAASSSSSNGATSPVNGGGAGNQTLSPRQMAEPIVIEWDVPAKNAQLVQYYRIFWRPIGTRELSRTITNVTWIRLSNLDLNRVYEFVIKAANNHGSSVYSDPLTVKPAELSSSSSSSYWFMEVSRTHESLMGRIIMAITFATLFMFSTLVLVLYMERRGYLRNFASSKSNNSRISFANPAYNKDDQNHEHELGSSPRADDQGGTSGATSPIVDTGDTISGSSFSRTSSEGRGSGGSNGSRMRFETITWDESEPQTGDVHSMNILTLPPLDNPLSTTTTTADHGQSSTISITNPNYGSS